MPTPNLAAGAASSGAAPGHQLACYGLNALRRAAATADTLREANPAGFAKVQALFKANERAHVQWVSPWVRMAAIAESARLLRDLYPMRTSRTVWSESVTPVLAWLPWDVVARAAAHRRDRVCGPGMVATPRRMLRNMP